MIISRPDPILHKQKLASFRAFIPILKCSKEEPIWAKLYKGQERLEELEENGKGSVVHLV